jgi:hypothetical protein
MRLIMWVYRVAYFPCDEKSTVRILVANLEICLAVKPAQFGCVPTASAVCVGAKVKTNLKQALLLLLQFVCVCVE